MKTLALAAFALSLASLACGNSVVDETAVRNECSTQSAEFTVDALARPFAMGFNRWPSDLTPEAGREMWDFIGQHSDLVLHHIDNGVPWPEALAGEPFSDHLISDWESAVEATPFGHTVFVAITPLNGDRSGLALYHGDTDNMPLPPPWDGYPLDHPDVKQAFFNYAIQAVEHYNPDYFAFAIEANLLLIESPEKWDAYVELHRDTYQALKGRYPELPIFATFTLPHIRGDFDGADSAEQQAAVGGLMQHNDLLALSIYAYNWIFTAQRAAPEDYFDLALQFGKPIAIAETGMPSRAFRAYGVEYDFEPSDQNRYVELLLRKAVEHDFVFVAAWAGIDFDPMLERFPDDVRELATYWAYTGLQRSDGCAKPALNIWDAYLALPRE